MYQEEQAARAARAAAAADEGGADGRPLTKKERTALEKAAAQVRGCLRQHAHGYHNQRQHAGSDQCSRDCAVDQA